MPIEIEFADKRWRRVPQLAQVIAKAHEQALPKRDAAKITILLLAGDGEVKRLNRLWRAKNKSTNVLSFPTARQKLPRGQIRQLGDIVLSYETCAKEATAEGKPLRDHAVHLTVHGLLHLVGHDHAEETKAAHMERREIRILAKLGIANPYVLDNDDD